MMNNMMMCSMHDYISTFEYGVVFGVVVGAALTFLLTRKIYHKKPTT